jgi:hypothetical protein
MIASAIGRRLVGCTESADLIILHFDDGSIYQVYWSAKVDFDYSCVVRLVVERTGRASGTGALTPKPEDS